MYIEDTGYSFVVKRYGKTISYQYETYEEAYEDMQSRM